MTIAINFYLKTTNLLGFDAINLCNFICIMNVLKFTNYVEQKICSSKFWGFGSTAQNLGEQI
jgi:phosphosulfolactate synthase (CoM biosynthesis protein A)